MRGDVPLEDVFARRLELVRPSRADVTSLGTRYVDTVVTDAREVVLALIAEGITVRIMSGGLLPAVGALGTFLGLERGAVAAVDVYFDELGAYAGFDRDSPLAHSGGKRLQLESWLPELPRPVLLVGDGVTDLEARPPADTFVAFTGVAHRPPVVAAADIVVRSASLAPVLALALGGIPPRQQQSRAIFDRGVRLMADG